MSVGIIERAFELARSGEYRSLDELKRRLAREGYEAVAAHLAGRMIKGQLTAMMNAAALPPAAIDRGPASSAAAPRA